MTMAIRPPSNLPIWVRWIAPNQNLGEFTLTTTFYGYEPFAGVNLPMGYTMVSDWRNVDQVKIYIDNYLVDSQIANLASTATFPPAPAGGSLTNVPTFQTLVPQVTPGQGGRGGAPGPGRPLHRLLSRA